MTAFGEEVGATFDAILHSSFVVHRALWVSFMPRVLGVVTRIVRRSLDHFSCKFYTRVWHHSLMIAHARLTGKGVLS